MNESPETQSDAPIQAIHTALIGLQARCLISPDARLSEHFATELESFIAYVQWWAKELNLATSELAALFAKGPPETWSKQEGQQALQISINCTELSRLLLNARTQFKNLCSQFGVVPEGILAVGPD